MVTTEAKEIEIALKIIQVTLNFSSEKQIKTNKVLSGPFQKLPTHDGL
jgi:hypothetical protein